MLPPFPHRIRQQQLWLSADRCIFWEEEKSLIVSDLHFGKTGHFRKAGIAVPQSVYREDLQRLLCQIQYFRPRQLLVVGDLFHSRENKELSLFRRWRDDFPDLGIRLIRGNHDILPEAWYADAGISVEHGVYRVGAFAFVHDIEEVGADVGGGGRTDVGAGKAETDETGEGGSTGAAGEAYYFSGHIHPGIRIRGMGRQSLQFPCFYFGEEYAVLPAYSRFTGTVSIDPSPQSHVFAILPPPARERSGPFHPMGRSAGSGKAGDKAALSGKAGDNSILPGKEEDKGVLPGKAGDKSILPGKGDDKPVFPGKGEDKSILPGKGGDKPASAGKAGDKPIFPWNAGRPARGAGEGSGSIMRIQ